MKFLFRVDASLRIGTGHVMRCLTLAKALAATGAQCHFACREHPGNLIDFIRQQGFEVAALPMPKDPQPIGDEAEVSALAHSAWLGCDWSTDAAQTKVGAGGKANDWLVVDHYALDASWESAMRNVAKKIMVIDDLADRRHECDVLLDQNFYVDMNSRYVDKVPPHCRMLLGPRFALLREEFREWRAQVRPRSGEVKRILMFFGGIDTANFTGLAIKALSALRIKGVEVDVVIGAQHPQRSEIEQACGMQGYACHVQTSRMAELMVAADLAIGAGGSATWERCCLGLPALSICTAENQRKQIADAAEAGLLYAPFGEGDLVNLIRHHGKCLLENVSLLKLISNTAMKMVDGLGAFRVGSEISSLEKGANNVYVRLAVADDAAVVWAWRNNESTRRYFFDPSPVGLETHVAWWNLSVLDPKRVLLIGSLGVRSFGVIRFDFDASESAVISIYVDSEMTGKGLGRKLLSAGLNWLKENHPEMSSVSAEILPENSVSVNVFQAAGFSEQYRVFALKF